jgi:hypothetical protein
VALLNPARYRDGYDEGEQARAQQRVRGRDEVEQESKCAEQQACDGKEDAQRGTSR